MTRFPWLSFQAPPVLGNLILCDSSTTVLSSSSNGQEISAKKKKKPFYQVNANCRQSTIRKNGDFFNFEI